MMNTPNWNAIAEGPLPADDQSDARMDEICDRLTGLLYRAHDLAAQIDPELADHFERTMTRAFRGGNTP